MKQQGPWHGELDTGIIRMRLAFRLDRGAQVVHLQTRAFGELTLPVRHEQGRIAFAAPQAEIALELTQDATGARLTGFCRHLAARYPISFQPDAPAPPPRGLRPQTPQGPFPYTSEEIVFGGADGTPRAGTLSRPHGPPRGAVILNSWYGQTDRDQTTAGHKPLAIWADELTRRGFATLRFDKRGAGASGGVFLETTTADLVQDLACAVAWLRRQPDIDPLRIGVMGHSEGGHVATDVAAEDPDIAFCVAMTPTGARDGETMPTDLFLAVRAVGGEPVREMEVVDMYLRLFAIERAGAGLDETMVRVRRVLEAAVDDGLYMAEKVEARTALVAWPWRRHWLAYDPTAAMARLTCPTLVVFAERDLQTPPSSHAPRIRARLAGHPQATVLELKGLNHFLQTAITGAPSEYGAIAETLAPSAIAAVCNWIEGANGPSEHWKLS